jgi:Tol biopolymer transport system component
MGLFIIRPIHPRIVAVLFFLVLIALASQKTFAQESNLTEEEIAEAQAAAEAEAIEFAQTDLTNAVIFSSYEENAWHVYLIDPDGTNKRPLSGKMGEIDGYSALRSPDGDYIVYLTQLGRTTQINLLSTDGVELRWLAEDPYPIEYITWLSDGEHLGFTSGDGISGVDVYVLDINSRQITRLTPNDGTHNKRPLWSPNGEKIAFTSDRDGEPNLYVMDADGSNIRQITADIDSHMSYTWSPDSETIVFSSNRDGHVNLYSLNLSTDALDQMTFKDENYDPVWSPDGTKIVFTSTRFSYGASTLYTMDGKGAHLEQISNTPFETWNLVCPMWTPDSQHIVVVNEDHSDEYPMPSIPSRDERADIFLVHVPSIDGRNMGFLTAFDGIPDMLPNCASFF